ncbi:prepilin-type N-terminal cleavage/methylation domain-containing protein [Pseudoxanthomonas sacheonensis]|uniref:General secretion pathway protein J n=1 Tax=Pseudoxanthomonas sacheonensis TaxID=443615 RepID=A0ABU1RYE8_9GAMM|nr:prepilin-type N-terminal cleavage/methylation domain-containing protein [Pseudoxanthomonas sacheonensis]MDR6843169.1 general secretion pathway protein J [Pseudoxanthomonas sacheonensis]
MNRNVRGFTLIEVLLATVLLAAGLALAFATLRSATAMVQRGETIAQRNERIRAVEGFLRRRISSAQAIAFAIDPNTQRQYRFVGEAQRMRFVADLPDYLGRGGPYLHDLVAADGGSQLLASFAMVQAGQAVREAQPRPPEILADNLRATRFRYRGLDQEGKLGEWQDRWTAAESLPLQVSIDIESADGQHWPGLVVSLAQGTGQDNGLGQGLEPPP